MKKILLTIVIFILTACTNKPVSLDYYSTHILEAKEELIKCANDKDENSFSCDNARKAIQAAYSKADDEKTANAFK
ncbi:MAG: EexN family lipoprotein [Burkholderiales bacterium]|nr:EexN family lipoprotein [Burkholderiales bacterium]